MSFESTKGQFSRDGAIDLAGREITMADLAAGAALSVVDYLGEVPWEEATAAKAAVSTSRPRRISPRFSPSSTIRTVVRATEVTEAARNGTVATGPIS